MNTTWRSAFVLGLLATVLGCSKTGEEPSTTGPERAREQTEPAVSSAELFHDPALPVAKNLGALVDLIVAEASELNYSEFDPAALAKKLGQNPVAHFEWVRDHTSWAPYRGLLRGPKGVMLDRVGSSLDRAVLLGDLLRRSGHTVRLAHAQLSEDRARALLGRIRPMPDQHRDPIAPRPVLAERQRAAEVDMPRPANGREEKSTNSNQRLDEAKAFARALADQLHANVRGIATKKDTDGGAVIGALRDHWWVEREENGSWIAMDTLLPDARMGEAIVEASGTSEWKAADDAPSIPDTDWHAVQIRVVVERYESGATTESTVLETTLRPARVFDRPITLMHALRPWPEDSQNLDSDKNAIRNAALEVREWVPFLRIGDDIIAQTGVTDAGDLIDNPFDSAPEMGGGSLFGGFDSSLGGSDQVASYATAEWIDYEILAPGVSNQRLRRPVFDLLGPAKRVAAEPDFDADSVTLVLERLEALAGSTDILLQPCNFTEEFFGYLISSSIVANQKELRQLSQERDPARAGSLALTLLDRVDIWGPLPELVLWRSALSSESVDWFFDRPNVLNYRVTWPVVEADRAALREMIDIASNAIGIRRGASDAPFEIRLTQGVSDTVAESLALESDLRVAENTAAVFALTKPERVMIIGPHDTGAVRRLDWPADAAARLAENVGAGFIAVAPENPVLLRERQRVGWWRVDPNSGETIGVMDTGYHGVSEYNLVRYKKFLINWVARNGKRVQYAKEIVGKGGKLYWKQSRMLARYEEVMGELASLAARGI